MDAWIIEADIVRLERALTEASDGAERRKLTGLLDTKRVWLARIVGETDDQVGQEAPRARQTPNFI